MRPELERLLKGVGSGNVTTEEAKYLEEVNRMRLKGSKFYLKYLNRYFDKKKTE